MVPILHTNEDTIDFKEQGNTLLKFKKMIILLTVGITFVTGIYAFITKPVYKAKAVLEIGLYSIINANSNINTNWIENPFGVLKK